MRKIDKRRSPETKERILDAAERLFSERGFHGTSLRDITKLSGMQVSLSYYHFGTKEEILKAVVDRRAEEHVQNFRQSLDRALATTQGEPLPPADLIEAFVRPALECLVGDDPGWKYYVQLLAHLAFESSRADYATPFYQYDELVKEFISELRRSLPGVSQKDLHWAFYFLQSANTNSLLETRMIDRQSNQLCNSANIEELVDELKTFFSLGLKALQARS